MKTPNHDRIGREGIDVPQCLLHQCALRAGACNVAYRAILPLHGSSKQPVISRFPCLPTFLCSPISFAKQVMKLPSWAKCIFITASKSVNGIITLAITTPANNYVNPIFKEGRDGKVGEAKQYMGVYPDDLAVDRALHWLEYAAKRQALLPVGVVCCAS